MSEVELHPITITTRHLPRDMLISHEKNEDLMGKLHLCRGRYRVISPRCAADLLHEQLTAVPQTLFTTKQPCEATDQSQCGLSLRCPGCSDLSSNISIELEEKIAACVESFRSQGWRCSLGSILSPRGDA